MKTDIEILWVDDNKDYVDAIRPQLEKWIDSLGFDLKVNFFRDGSTVASELKKRPIELVVLDYKLRGTKTGDAIIKDIRDKNYYHDIVFYSQGHNPADVVKTPVDGVFFVERGDAKDRVKDLLELKIKRSSDLATFRGWVVADAIELESVLNRVLAKCFGTKTELFTNCVLQHEGLFDFYKKLMVLNSIMHARMDELKAPENKDCLDKLRACKKILDCFADEVVHMRNALAHQIAVENDDGNKTIKLKSKTKVFLNTQENLISVRKNLRKHRENLIQLEAII